MWPRLPLMFLSCFLLMFRCDTCIATGADKLQVLKPPPVTATTQAPFPMKANETDELHRQSQIGKEFRAFRFNLLGSRNMTINLTNLVVLGLGMAAAVSLFSFFENPGLSFKRSMPGEINEHFYDSVASFVDHLASSTFKDDWQDKGTSSDSKSLGSLIKDYFSKLAADNGENPWSNLFNRFRGLINFGGVKTNEVAQDYKT